MGVEVGIYFFCKTRGAGMKFNIFTHNMIVEVRGGH